MLMKLLGVSYQVVVSDFDEESIKISNPAKFVERLSFEKAKLVSSKNKKAIVIGADTAVVLGTTILGKPKDEKDAFKTLSRLSGTKHQIVTGFTVIDGRSGKVVTRSSISKVQMKKLTPAEIKAYIKTKEPMDKAGSYAVNEMGGLFVEKIEGDFFNIIGLPIKDVRLVLNELGIKTLV